MGWHTVESCSAAAWAVKDLGAASCPQCSNQNNVIHEALAPSCVSSVHSECHHQACFQVTTRELPLLLFGCPFKMSPLLLPPFKSYFFIFYFFCLVEAEGRNMLNNILKAMVDNSGTIIRRIKNLRTACRVFSCTFRIPAILLSWICGLDIGPFCDLFGLVSLWPYFGEGYIKFQLGVLRLVGPYLKSTIYSSCLSTPRLY